MSVGGQGSGAGAAPAAAAAGSGTPQHSLHDEIASFVAAVTEMPQEHAVKATAVRRVQTAVRAAGLITGSHVEVQTFGSFVNGLGMHSSDLDLVITGLLTPDHPQNGGYGDKTKVQVNRLLGQVRGALFRAGDLASCEQVRRARVPILKCVLKGGQHVDVSISNGDGPAAAKYVRDKVAEHPALRPLVLVLKCVLGQADLNDASRGGLSSFALASMALASLQEDAKAGRSGADFGAALNSFLLRYGTTFKVYTEGVAVGRGGIVKKEQVPAMAAVLADPTRKDGTDALQRLCVEDPQTGREVAGGTGKVKQVLAAFRDAGAKLHQAQFLGRPGGCLRGLFDVDAAVRRDVSTPQQASKQPAAKAQRAQLPTLQAPPGKRKRQPDAAAASPQPAAKRHAAQPRRTAGAPGAGAASGANAIPQRRQSAAAGSGQTGVEAVPAAGTPRGMRHQPMMSPGARPLPSQARSSGAGASPHAGYVGSRGGTLQGGRGGSRLENPHHAGRQHVTTWRPEWRPQQQQQSMPPPAGPVSQPPASQRQPALDMPPVARGGPAPLPTGSQMASNEWRVPPSQHVGPGGPFGQRQMRPPPQQQPPGFGTPPHSGHWHPRPQGQHIRFPDDEWSPPVQQQHQQHLRPPQDVPWVPPQQQQQWMPPQQQQTRFQHEHQQQAASSWQHQPQQPDWQPPQHGMGPDWQPPVQQPGGGIWQEIARHAGPEMRSPRWR